MIALASLVFIVCMFILGILGAILLVSYIGLYALKIIMEEKERGKRKRR